MKWSFISLFGAKIYNIPDTAYFGQHESEADTVVVTEPLGGLWTLEAFFMYVELHDLCAKVQMRYHSG